MSSGHVFLGKSYDLDKLSLKSCLTFDVFLILVKSDPGLDWCSSRTTDSQKLEDDEGPCIGQRVNFSLKQTKYNFSPHFTD